MIATTINTRSLRGIKPKRFPEKKSQYCFGKEEIAEPFVITTQRTVKISFTPSVARIGGTPSFEIKKAFRLPTTIPITIAIRKITTEKASGIVPSAPNNLVSVNTVRIEAILAVPTTERSIPPVIMHNIPPRAIRPYSGNCPAMVRKFIPV